MRLSRRMYRMWIIVHVASSVVWLGLSLCLLVLGLTVLTTADPGVQFAAGTAASILASAIALPVGATALVSGLVLMLGTRWGPRYRWVSAKLVATCVTFALTVLLLRPGLAEAASRLDPVRLVEADAGVIAGPVVSSAVYVGAIVLSYVKPWGAAGAVSSPRRGRVPARSGR